MVETILVWLMMGLSTDKFGEDFHVSPHKTKELCIAEAEREGWEDWSCVPVLMPAGEDLVIVNDHDDDACAYDRGERDWFGNIIYSWEVCEGEQH